LEISKNKPEIVNKTPPPSLAIKPQKYKFNIGKLLKDETLLEEIMRKATLAKKTQKERD
jgi:hypothetical protein